MRTVFLSSTQGVVEVPLYSFAPESCDREKPLSTIFLKMAMGLPLVSVVAKEKDKLGHPVAIPLRTAKWGSPGLTNMSFGLPLLLSLSERKRTPGTPPQLS